MEQEIFVKSVLNKSQLPESNFCINPYVGCIHNCKYCYARFMRRFTGHQEAWGSFVDIKINAPEILKKQLTRKMNPGSVLIGSVCDAYQNVEKKYQITRQCISLLIEYQTPFSILTKSKLVLRDLDLFVKFRDNLSVGISLSILDDSIRKHFEPGASSVQDRLQTLKTLSEHGIKTYLFIGPILPLITDINEIINESDNFTNEIWGEKLNIKCGNLDFLKRAYSASKISYNWLSLTNSKDYWIEMERKMISVCNSKNKNLQGFYNH